MIEYHNHEWYKTVANRLEMPIEKLYKFIEIIYSIVSDSPCYDGKMFDYEFEECSIRLFIRYSLTNGKVHQQALNGKDIVNWMI